MSGFRAHLGNRFWETMKKGLRQKTQAFDLYGGSCRIRTCDQLIKSQLLYQLS